MKKTNRYSFDSTVRRMFGQCLRGCFALAILAACAALPRPILAARDEPFGVEVTLLPGDAPDVHEFKLTLRVADGHYLYADVIRVTTDEAFPLTRLTATPPKREYEPILEEETNIYDADATWTYRVEGALPIPLTIEYQGCSKEPMICFLPETRQITLGGNEEAGATSQAREGAITSWRTLADKYRLAGKAVGYMPTADFLAFLDEVEAGRGIQEDRLSAALRDRGLWAVLLSIFIGGLALNLTPCVLPMIPINLAIIGAGAQAGSRSRGFALGATYGVGIALVYGMLGLVVVLSGATFGALNASPWFNLGIAALFVVLSLAMFGVFQIDFSRFQAGGASGKRGGFMAAFAMGCVAALLAGACVAPVVISVLLLSADLYARGAAAGLLLPFALGLGMAIPWPFAGSGLSFLPKPGRWMAYVKIAFGVLILLFALWYGKLGISLLLARSAPAAEGVTAIRQADGPAPVDGTQPAEAQPAVKDGWLTSLEAGLAEGLRLSRPVFVDFWATWCKNCLHMDRTTFQDPDVLARLDASYVRVKFQAEDVRDPRIKEVLDYAGAVGLPTYIVLTPRD